MTSCKLPFFDGLNESQKKAVMHAEGPALIVAGPGTGKTLTIVRRIAYLINQGVNPENILAVTFTNRAAKEMKERTDALLGKDSGKIFIGTFHLLGLRIIRDALSSSFVIYNRDEQINLIKPLTQDSVTKAQQAAEKISRIKNFLEDADNGIKGIYEEYQSALIKNSALDFDDLILKPIDILSNIEVAENYRDTFRYIMVDEYQDINPAQYKLLTLLSHTKGNLCAIGDSDQAIYAFRGADVSNFLNFEKDFRDAKTITLTENYRSTAVILNASNILIRNNLKRIDKILKATREKGTHITVVSVPDEKAEGEIIVREVEERMGGTSHYQLIRGTLSPLWNPPEECSYNFSDFAVIFRTNAQARTIEEAFITSGIPYQMIGAKHILKRSEITDTLSYLKTIVNPKDNLSLGKVSTISPKGLNGAALERFMDLKDRLPLDEFLEVVLEESGLRTYYKDREDNFMLLENIATAYRDMEPSEAIISFINELSLLTPADAYDSRADAVTLMTLHMAKGLEFKVVFITGVEDGLIPYTIKKDGVDIEEERRLFYVGMTRAKDELFLIHARNRFLYGQRLAQESSPFLREIPEEFIEHRFIRDRIKNLKKDSQIGLF